MARKDRRYGREVFNQFFLRENYTSNEFFEEAIKKRLGNSYWDIGQKEKANIKVIRNKHGARVVAYKKLDK